MKTREIIDSMADGFIHIAPLPDITPLQKLINRLYVKLRICGMPAEEVSRHINILLNKHGIKKNNY